MAKYTFTEKLTLKNHDKNMSRLCVASWTSVHAVFSRSLASQPYCKTTRWRNCFVTMELFLGTTSCSLLLARLTTHVESCSSVFIFLACWWLQRGKEQLEHALVQLVDRWPRDFSNPSFKFYSRWVCIVWPFTQATIRLHAVRSLKSETSPVWMCVKASCCHLCYISVIYRYLEDVWILYLNDLQRDAAKC